MYGPMLGTSLNEAKLVAPFAKCIDKHNVAMAGYAYHIGHTFTNQQFRYNFPTGQSHRILSSWMITLE